MAYQFASRDRLPIGDQEKEILLNAASSSLWSFHAPLLLPLKISIRMRVSRTMAGPPIHKVLSFRGQSPGSLKPLGIEFRPHAALYFFEYEDFTTNFET